MNGLDLVGKWVRFNHEPEGAAHWVATTKGDGSMVELLDFSGWFAPHLFVLVEPPHGVTRRDGGRAGKE
jgi:hypothetical protein